MIFCRKACNLGRSTRCSVILTASQSWKWKLIKSSRTDCPVLKYVIIFSLKLRIFQTFHRQFVIESFPELVTRSDSLSLRLLTSFCYNQIISNVILTFFLLECFIWSHDTYFCSKLKLLSTFSLARQMLRSSIFSNVGDHWSTENEVSVEMELFCWMFLILICMYLIL